MKPQRLAGEQNLPETEKENTSIACNWITSDLYRPDWHHHPFVVSGTTRMPPGNDHNQLFLLY
jgi:hypothetical protein